MFGHYREPHYTQVKHHWWWKLHHIFSSLTVTVKFQGLVVFLEEDHYVAPDFIEVAKLTARKCYQTSGCAFIGLGTTQKFKSAGSDEVSCKICDHLNWKHQKMFLGGSVKHTKQSGIGFWPSNLLRSRDGLR